MMESKSVRFIAVIFIVLTIVMAGLFFYEYSASKNYESKYASLQSSYSGQQSSVVLSEAYSHWDYIAIENSSLLRTQYEPNATLHWIGGPLSGTYRGVNNITSTWNKFFGLWSAIWYYTELPPTVSLNGNNAIVTSLNQFVLTPFTYPNQVQYLNISYTINYGLINGSWLINSETWHIVGSGYVSPGQQFVIQNYVENLAFSHWNNIAIENNTLVMEQYGANATLKWIGGPLNGTYSGISQINETWSRFFGLWSAVWFYAQAPPSVTIKGNVANVSANIQFVVQNSANLSQFKYINVSYTILYYNSGFMTSSGMPLFYIYYEVFHITGTNALNKI